MPNVVALHTCNAHTMSHAGMKATVDWTGVPVGLGRLEEKVGQEGTTGVAADGGERRVFVCRAITYQPFTG